MSVTLNGFGLRPAYSPQGHLPSAGLVCGTGSGIASGYAANLLKYQPVALNSSGNLVAATVGSDIYGVFMGVTWVDAQGIPHSSDMWTSGTVYSGSGTPMYAWVQNDPNQVYSIQANGSLAGAIGGQVNFASTIASGSTTTGLSSATADASSLSTSAQKQLRIVALDPSLLNAWGDAFTTVQVQIAQHQFIANKVAV